MSKNAAITWVAYCTEPDCEGEIYSAPNGEFVEAAAELHAEETGHKVLVGYYIEEDNGKRQAE
jgi:hypothetical protein